VLDFYAVYGGGGGRGRANNLILKMKYSVTAIAAAEATIACSATPQPLSVVAGVMVDAIVVLCCVMVGVIVDR